MIERRVENLTGMAGGCDRHPSDAQRLGTGVPACDSRYEVGQVRKAFDGLGPVKAAGIASVAVASPRELGASGDVRTCAAQVGATKAQSYAVVYTVECRDAQILTTIQIR